MEPEMHQEAKDFSSIKAVFFDAGGTLLYPFPSVGIIYRDVAARYGCQAEAEHLEFLFRQAWLKRDGMTALVSHSSEKKEKDWWHSLVHEVFTQVGEVRDFEAFFNELYEIFGRPEVWRLYPGTLEVLEALNKKGKKVGIVSNWDSRLFQLCKGLKLEDHVDFILASAVFGAAKPNMKIFQAALAKAGVKPHEAVHVGDSVEDDISGARAAGLEALLINRHPERDHHQQPALNGVGVIEELGDLLALL